MRKIDILGKITELVDGEIKNSDEEKILPNRIYSEREYLKEYQIQRNIKNLLKNRAGAVNASERLKQSIIRNYSVSQKN